MKLRRMVFLPISTVTNNNNLSINCKIQCNCSGISKL